MPAPIAGRLLSIAILLCAVQPGGLSAAGRVEPAAAALSATAEMFAAFHRGDFAAMEQDASAEVAAVPATPADADAMAARIGALVPVSIGATLAEAFEPGAAVAGEARRDLAGLPPGRRSELQVPVAFAEAFNACRRGRPLAALAILRPVLATPAPADASGAAWIALASALAGKVHSAIGEFDAGLALSAEARTRLSALRGSADPLAVVARLWHVEALVAAGRAEGATEVEAMLDEPRSDARPVPVLGALLADLALGFVSLEESDSAARLVFDAAMAGAPADHTLVARGLADLAYAAELRGDHQGAIDSLQAALDIYARSLDPAAPEIGDTVMTMAMVAANLGAAPEALDLAAAGVDIARRGTGAASHVTAVRLVEAATVHAMAGKPDAALAFIAEARRLLAGQGSDDWRLTRVFLPMQEAKALMAAGRPAEAAALAADTLEGLSATPWAEGPAVSIVEVDRALALHASGNDLAALASARRAIAGLLATRSTGDGAVVGGIFAAVGRGAGASVSDSLRLAALTLVRSAWRHSEVRASP